MGLHLVTTVHRPAPSRVQESKLAAWLPSNGLAAPLLPPSPPSAIARSNSSAFAVATAAASVAATAASRALVAAAARALTRAASRAATSRAVNNLASSACAECAFQHWMAPDACLATSAFLDGQTPNADVVRQLWARVRAPDHLGGDRAEIAGRTGRGCSPQAPLGPSGRP